MSNYLVSANDLTAISLGEQDTAVSYTHLTLPTT